jgi:phosphoribosylformylglycinamidine cyclo-ligase
MNDSLTCTAFDVDNIKTDELVCRIKDITNSTSRTGVMGEIGGVGGLYSMSLSNLNNPVLVTATDGVGIKLKIAFMMDKHDTIGIDLVAMCMNNVVVRGARPLFFHDYLAMDTLNKKVAEQILTGIANGCNEAACALIGGATAEIPGMFQHWAYDVAGFAVGIVDNDKIIDGAGIRKGHKLIGLVSSGVHSNGFSLIKKILFDKCNYTVNTKLADLDNPLGEELLKPSIIYVKTLLTLIRDLPIHGMVHVSRGGINDNIIRIIPESCKAVIRQDCWDIPPIFKIIMKEGDIPESEMRRTFNYGIGMILIVPENSTQDVMDRLAVMSEKAFFIGEIETREMSEAKVQWV